MKELSKLSLEEKTIVLLSLALVAAIGTGLISLFG